MKKINSIHFGHKIIAWILVFAVLFPLLLYIIDKFMIIPYMAMLIRISITLGIVLTLILSIILMIEFRQDKRLEKYYQYNSNKKILLNTGKYECQTCGNTSLKADDKYCIICGIKFEDEI